MKEKKIKNVLLVEDNLVYREIDKIQFTHPNYHIDIAKGIAIATKELNKKFYSLILNNLYLPENIGSEAIKFIY